MCRHVGQFLSVFGRIPQEKPPEQYVVTLPSGADLILKDTDKIGDVGGARPYGEAVIKQAGNFAA